MPYSVVRYFRKALVRMESGHGVEDPRARHAVNEYLAHAALVVVWVVGGVKVVVVESWAQWCERCAVGGPFAGDEC